MGIVCSSTDTLNYYSRESQMHSHISTKSRREWDKTNSRLYTPSSSSVDPSSFADGERSASMSITGTMYNFSTMQSSSIGRGSVSNKPRQSSESENVTSPLRPVSTAKIKIPAVAEFYPEFKKMITGRLDDEMEISLEKKIIYVYHCTYHTDSLAEREELHNQVYPWLREYCREQGCCLEVVDLAWGLKDFHAHDHACRKLPLPILRELLMNQGDCSIVTVLLNEKYGTYWIPIEIEEQDFQMILKKVTENEKQFVNQWYKLSEIFEPCSYILQPVELHCEKYGGSAETFRDGLREWEKQHLRLKIIMNKAFPQAKNKTCQTSDIERDLEETVLSELCQCKNVIVLHRKLTNMHLDDAMHYPQLEDFIDISGEHLNETAQARLKALSTRLMDKVEEERRIELQVPWLAMVNIDGGGLGHSSPEDISIHSKLSTDNEQAKRSSSDEKKLSTEEAKSSALEDTLFSDPVPNEIPQLTAVKENNEGKPKSNKNSNEKVLHQTMNGEEVLRQLSQEKIKENGHSKTMQSSTNKSRTDEESSAVITAKSGDSSTIKSDVTAKRRSFSSSKKIRKQATTGSQQETSSVDYDNFTVGNSEFRDREENLKDRRNYLTNMSVAYRLVLKDIIDETIVKLKSKDIYKSNMISRGLSETLYTDLVQHCKMAMDYRYTVLGQNDFLQQLESFVVKGNGGNEDKSYPVFVHGAAGMGKTALMSVLTANVFSLDKWKNCVCVMRYAGASKGCMTVQQIVHSIGLQLCVLAGHPLKTVTQHKEKVLHQLLGFESSRLLSSQNLLIMIDGVDEMEGGEEAGYESFTWLPRVLPAYVRILLTANSASAVCGQFREYMSADAHCMEIPRLFPADLFAILSRFLHQYQRAVSEEMQHEIYQQIQTSASPLLVQIISVCLVHFNGDTVIKNMLKEELDLTKIINMLFSLIERQFGKHYMSVLCCMLACTRHGTCQNEFIDIASCHPGICEETLVNNQQSTSPPKRVPCLQWYAITSTLHPFLHFHVSQGVHLCKWKHAVFRDICMQRYKEGMAEVQNLLQQYWLNELKAEEMVHVQKQPMQFPSGLYNGRVFDELLHVTHGNIDTFKDKILNALFIQGLMQLNSPHVVLNQLKIFPESEDLNVLQTMIKHLEPILMTNKKCFLIHLYSYITFNHINTEKQYPLIHELYQEALKQLPPLLQPLYGLGSFTFGYSESETTCKYTNTGIFRIKGDDDHVVVIAKGNNEVKIFNFHTELNHRLLRDVEMPRHVEVINMFRAVILCDRQLHIYDLDKGRLFSKLKGVLNLRMPYFGIHTEEHTMAMSRNRMYVNMLHNITGEVVTTFKVGEDRFLNSLLVSDNGEVCVCGDEVQKPFPLLVWNLKHRKLIHDFRIRGHEFITRMAAITRDGQCVVTVCREVEDPEPNFLIAYDLQNGTMFTKIKPEHSCTAVKISSEARIIVSTHENGDVLVWNLNDSSVAHSPKFVLRGHTGGADQLTLSDDGQRGVTYDSRARDPTIWMWDFVKGIALGCIPSVIGPSCCQISADGNAVIAAFPRHNHVFTFCVRGQEFVPNLQAVYGDSARKGKVFHMDKLS